MFHRLAQTLKLLLRRTCQLRQDWVMVSSFSANIKITVAQNLPIITDKGCGVLKPGNISTDKTGLGYH